MMGGFGSGMGGFGGFGLLGGLLNLIVTLGIIVGLVLLVIWAVRRFSGTDGSVSHLLNNTTQTDQSAREIIKQRYARGEIDREHYQQMLADLS